MATEALQQTIARQRQALTEMLSQPLAEAAHAASEAWGEAARLDEALEAAIHNLPYCKYMYALRPDGIQISANLMQNGRDAGDVGRDRSLRPYMREAVPISGFLLSQAYISMRVKRPSLTAIQLVRDDTGHVLGYIGADFDLRDLPLTRELADEPRNWRQIKGDPAIRGTVFHQSRSDSQMDLHIDTVLGVMEELILDHGVFHCKLHLSSSRVTLWLMDDPYRYRLLDIASLTRPDICLTFPRCNYPTVERSKIRECAHRDGVLPCGMADPGVALIPAERIRDILQAIKRLRFIDETFYLRSANLNIFNGMVALTFSCDGTHYLPWDEFLTKGDAFWVGGDVSAAQVA